MLARSGFSLPTRTTLTGDWADLLREHFVALDVSDIEDGDGFSGAVHSAQLAHVRVSAVQSMEQRIVRSSSLIKSDGADYLQIGMIRRGSAVVRQDDRECVLRRGDYVLYDTTRPFDWQIEGHAHDGIWGLEVFTWPRSYLSLSDAEVTNLTAIAFDGHAGLSGLLGRFLHDLASVRMTSDASGDEEEVVNEIGSLVKSVLHATARPITSQRTNLYESALSVIDARIADPALSPVDIAGSVKVSIRQLHRAFAEHGTTVSRSIRSRRLDGCRREIVQRHAVERSLTQISHRWGFTDLAAFSRAFKAEFGISPRRYRSQAAGPTSTAR
ncbi:MAG: helix-turn-helix domain-containing protein [Rhodococcus sp. (in: high G+C Gram-positive bacteria)]|uniref:helix-turn-helix domain-containing protein n=1 Tax=Rhodococcus sp. TaxID=1831 RepID=UPI002AD9B797|nr:helix-turn-helix domain-containing protein [Rhodococcus sp. (in: high G+C Gram-positive bacteria)]